MTNGHKKFLWRLLFFLGMTVAAVSAARGEDPFVIPEACDPIPSWEIWGSNTFHFDWYRNCGDEENAIHNIVGSQFYDEIAFEFSRKRNPYDSIWGRFNGVANSSEYRYDSMGFIPEQFSMVWEKGDVAAPFRLRLGDYYGFYTYRTFQRSLKGFQFELQPLLGRGTGLNHSVVLTTGTAALRDYKDGVPSDDLYLGGSWLINAGPANLSLNVMRNTRGEDIETRTPDRAQTVYSLGGEYEKAVWDQKLMLEGEWAYFEGDVRGQGRGIDEDKSDQGYFFQLRGRSKRPLTYEFKFEDYGKNFQPNGSVVPPDRRTWESRAGYRFSDGFGVNGRIQRFIDGRERGNPLTTDVVGLSGSGLIGFMPVKGLVMSFDSFISENKDLGNTIDTKTISSRVDLSMPIRERLSGRIGGSAQQVKNYLTNRETEYFETHAGISQGFSFLGLTGGISPGLFYASTDVQPDGGEDQYGFDVALNMAGARNSVAAGYRFQRNNPHSENSSDVSTHSINAAYTYTIGPNSFSTEIEVYNRDPQRDEDSTGYRVAAYWTFWFSKPARRIQKGAARTGLAEETDDAYTHSVMLAQLVPGAPLKNVLDRLSRGGIKGGVDLPGMVVFPTQFIEEISQRQQLAVVHTAGIVTKAAVVVELEDTGAPETARRLFERIRRILIQKYGVPETFERGEFSDNLSEDINRLGVIRVAEWPTEAGIIRLGIPRRLDRKVRIEIQHASQFPPPTMTLWSIEGLP